MSDEKHFSVDHVDDVAIVRMVDPHMYETILVNEFEEELAAFLTIAPSKVIVDFANVTQCSTAVINALITAQKQAKSMQGELKLCSLKETIRQAFRILKLDGTIFDIRGDVDEAIAAFQS